jgi:hypothetical protein
MARADPALRVELASQAGHPVLVRRQRHPATFEHLVGVRFGTIRVAVVVDAFTHFGELVQIEPGRGLGQLGVVALNLLHAQRVDQAAHQPQIVGAHLTPPGRRQQGG